MQVEISKLSKDEVLDLLRAEPWRFPLAVYVEAFLAGDVRITTTDGRLITLQTTGYGYYVDSKHKLAVERAMEAGLPVPMEVTQDYPEFLNPNGRVQRRRRQALTSQA